MYFRTWQFSNSSVGLVENDTENIQGSSIEDGGTRTTLIRVRRKQCTLKRS